MQEQAQELVAGSLRTGDGLGEQSPGLIRLDGIVGQQADNEAMTQQDVVAELTGAFDSLPAKR